MSAGESRWLVFVSPRGLFTQSIFHSHTKCIYYALTHVLLSFLPSIYIFPGLTLHSQYLKREVFIIFHLNFLFFFTAIHKTLLKIFYYYYFSIRWSLLLYLEIQKKKFGLGKMNEVKREKVLCFFLPASSPFYFFYMLGEKGGETVVMHNTLWSSLYFFFRWGFRFW